MKFDLESKLAHLAHWVFRHYKKIIPATMVTILLLATSLINIRMDLNTESFLYEDDPKRVAYSEFRDQFGRDEKVIIAIEGENIFDPAFLNTLHQLQSELATTVPYVKDISSLLNARKSQGDGDLLIVEDLFKRFPVDEASALSAKTYTQNSPFFKNLLISEDGKLTAIVITSQTYSSIGATAEATKADEFGEFDEPKADTPKTKQPFITAKENAKMVHAINDVVAKYQASNFKIYTVGSPTFIEALKSELIWSMLTFVFLLIVAIVFLLSRFFKRKEGVMLPMMTAGLTVLSTMSLMTLLGFPLSNMSAILPSFILSIAVGSSVHVLSIFFKEFDRTGDKEGSVAYALTHSGLAVILTTLTTAGSLLSFTISDIPPIVNLGLFAAIGAIIALLLTMVMLPAMIAKLDIKPRKEYVESHNAFDSRLESIGRFSIRHSKVIVVLSSLFIVTTLYFSTNIQYKHDPLAWLPADNIFRTSSKLIDEKLKGTVSLEVIVDTKVENGVYNPALLKAIEKTTEQLNALKGDGYFVGKTVSIVDILKETNQSLHGNNPEFYTIPVDQALIAQEFLLFENSGSDDLETIVDSKFSKTRITVKIPWVDATTYKPLLSDAEKIVKENLSTYGSVVVTGMVPMLIQTVNATIDGTIDSYIIAYAFILVLMIVLLRNLKLGLIAMVPTIAPVFIGLTTMLLFSMNLDLFTILVGDIAMGMAIDDTIHFMYSFKREYNRTGDVDYSILETMKGAGGAMSLTSVVLTLGFFVYMFSDMSNIFNFGAITGIVIIFALIAVLFLVPAILKLTTKNKEIS